jgi:hypothetical protein
MSTYFKTYVNGNYNNTHAGSMDPNNHQKVGDTAAELLRVMQSMFADDVRVTAHTSFDGPALCSYTRNVQTGTVTGTPA